MDAPTLPAVSSNAALAKLDDYALILVIAAERGDLLVYGKQAEQIIQNCK